MLMVTGWLLVVLELKRHFNSYCHIMVVCDAYVFPGFLTPVLTQLFFSKPPATFLACFCRGERRKYAGKKSCLSLGSNSQPPGHESDTLTTQRSHGHCDLDLWPIDLKINSDHLHPKTHVCAKFDKPRSSLCIVIIRTRFGLYVNM